MSGIRTSFVNSAGIFKDAFKVLLKHPVMFLPILANVILFSCITIYLVFHFDRSTITTVQKSLGFMFSVIVLYCSIISFNSFVLLEFIQQVEGGRKTNTFDALYEVIFKDIPRALPIMLVWAIVWFVLEVINILLKAAKSKRGNTSRDRRINAARGSISLIESGIRMLVFYVYPAIAWEDMSPLASVKKAFKHLKELGAEFLIGFGGIEVLMSLIAVPLVLYLHIVDKFDINPSDIVLTAIIIYSSIVFSMYVFLQQAYVAILYLWIMKWQKEMVNAVVNKLPIPEIHDVKLPSLVDDNFDLCSQIRKS